MVLGCDWVPQYMPMLPPAAIYPICLSSVAFRNLMWRSGRSVTKFFPLTNENLAAGPRMPWI